MKRRIHRLMIVTVSFIVFACGCQPTPVRLKESQVNSTFPHSSELPFDAYMEKTRQMVEQTREDLEDLNGPGRAEIIGANTPFELVPDPAWYPQNDDGKFANGVLLIHGLSDSPYHMRQIGNHLRDKGFLVRAMLLPGHGTVPGDLISVRYEEWIKAVRYGVQRMAPRVERLFVAGFSTGGALGVYHSLVYDDIQGLLLFSPALAVKSPMAFLAPLVSFVKTWLGKEDDLDFAKYESFTTNAGAQIYKLTQAIDQLVEEKGKRLSIPVFTALSHEDATVDAEYYIKFFENYVTHPQSRVLLYTSRPLPELAGNSRVELLNSRVDKEDGRPIVNFAHTSITLPPHDPHYGNQGEYRNCLHYGRSSEERRICLSGKALVLGEKGSKDPESRKKYETLQRLTYNPLYEDMMDRMDSFLLLD